MKKIIDAEEMVNLLVSDLLQRSGVEPVVFRQIYAKHRQALQQIALCQLLLAILSKAQKRNTTRRAGVTKRFLIFLMKVLVSDRVGIALPDFKANDFSRWIGWGEQVKDWLEERQAKAKRVS